jgi:hypothetical protein
MSVARGYSEREKRHALLVFGDDSNGVTAPKLVGRISNDLVRRPVMRGAVRNLGLGWR